MKNIFQVPTIYIYLFLKQLFIKKNNMQTIVFLKQLC